MWPFSDDKDEVGSDAWMVDAFDPAEQDYEEWPVPPGSDDKSKYLRLMSSRTNNGSATEQVVDSKLDVPDILGKRKRDPRSKTRYGEDDYKEPTMFDKFNMGGNVLRGLGEMAQGWAALQNVGVARKSQAFKEDAWRQNMARQKTTVNNPIRMQQSVLKSDFYNDPARANSLKLVT